jgi:hypothetical protein
MDLQVKAITSATESDIATVTLEGVTIVHNGECKVCEEWPLTAVMINDREVCMNCLITAVNEAYDK